MDEATWLSDAILLCKEETTAASTAEHSQNQSVEMRADDHEESYGDQSNHHHHNTNTSNTMECIQQHYTDISNSFIEESGGAYCANNNNSSSCVNHNTLYKHHQKLISNGSLNRSGAPALLGSCGATAAAAITSDEFIDLDETYNHLLTSTQYPHSRNNINHLTTTSFMSLHSNESSLSLTHHHHNNHQYTVCDHNHHHHLRPHLNDYSGVPPQLSNYNSGEAEPSSSAISVISSHHQRLIARNSKSLSYSLRGSGSGSGSGCINSNSVNNSNRSNSCSSGSNESDNAIVINASPVPSSLTQLTDSTHDHRHSAPCSTCYLPDRSTLSFTNLDQESSSDCDLQRVGDVDQETSYPPARRRPGRPRGIRKKKPEKLGRLWEFIRDLLLNPESCPSLICWDNYDEGMFRFVHSDKVAKLWGAKRDNPDMNYEKLSRAMRYYYKSNVLQPVFGRRLVYKFGPEARGWKTTNPNFLC